MIRIELESEGGLTKNIYYSEDQCVDHVIDLKELPKEVAKIHISTE